MTKRKMTLDPESAVKMPLQWNIPTIAKVLKNISHGGRHVARTDRCSLIVRGCLG